MYGRLEVSLKCFSSREANLQGSLLSTLSRGLAGCMITWHYQEYPNPPGLTLINSVKLGPHHVARPWPIALCLIKVEAWMCVVIAQNNRHHWPESLWIGTTLLLIVSHKYRLWISELMFYGCSSSHQAESLQKLFTHFHVWFCFSQINYTPACMA